MPGPVVQLSDPWSWVPDWLKPQGASVTDPAWVPPVRFTFNKAVNLVHALGLDDPQQQVLGLMGAMTAPGGEASTASAVLDAAAEKFPRLAKVIKAFHASPHDFDQFSTNYIGSGEGNQMAGHGLYFAEHEPVSLEYARQFNRGPFRGDEADLAQYFTPGREIPNSFGGSDRVISFRPSTPDNRGWAVTVQELNAKGEAVGRPRQHATLPSMGAVNEVVRPGHQGMYEVAIHADPEHFVDLNKRLSEQSQVVQDAFRSQGITDMSMHADDAYNALGGTEGIQGSTRRLMEQPHGSTPIAGLKYLDQQSRLIPQPELVEKTIADLQGYRAKVAATMAEDPDTTTRLLKDVDADIARYQAKLTPEAQRATHNFVVFDDALIEIRRKYGWVLPAAVGAQVEYLRRKANQQGGKIAQSDLDGI